MSVLEPDPEPAPDDGRTMPQSGPGSGSGAADLQRLLSELHALIGTELEVDLSLDDQFFGLGFRSRLLRIETLPSSDSVIAYFDNGVTIDLAPGEQIRQDGGEAITLAVGKQIVFELRSSAEGNP